MARFRASDVNNYGGNGGGGYFSLKNDKDVAKVRFMYNSIDDVEGYAVHKVELDGKNRWVNCIREYNEPMNKCPFCANKNPQYAKLFIPLYNIDEKKIQIWERGKKFFSKLSSICARYPDLVHHIFEIERNGAAGSMDTTYEIYEVDDDDTRLEDLGEIPEILGGLVLDKSADDMEYFLSEGEFPPEDNEEPVRRRSSERSERSSERREEGRRSRAERRTPAGRRVETDEDEF